MILFYEHYGKANSFNVTWYDEPKEWGSESGNKTISIDLVKNQQLLYKLTIFINTGVIQAQGQSGLICNKGLSNVKDSSSWHL